MPNDRILLISNYWEWKLTAILSLLIRIFGYGINHAAILINGEVHEMVGSDLRWLAKRLLGFKVSYLPNEGSGYITTPYEVWLTKAKRIVIEMKPLVEGELPEVKEGYGFLDLIQVFLHIVRTKWLLIGHNWNGEDGTRLWKGMYCSELGGRYLKRADAHILTPMDLRLAPELEFVREFRTYKK